MLDWQPDASEKFMRNVIRQDFGDSLRAEYTRSDFGEMVQGKYADTQVKFAELLRLLLTCVGEDEEVNFIHYAGDQLAGHKQGDWTYEIDNANHVTLRYWLNEFRTVEEPISNPPYVTTPEERSDLQKLILDHVRILKARVDQLKP
jgi:hypothetical protein